jgi:hypothetical protein
MTRPWKPLAMLTALLAGLIMVPRMSTGAGTLAAIEVLSPSGAAADVLPEGEDYFTLVLGDPRDMNERLDLRFQYDNVTNISVQDGLWRGYGGSHVFPLFFPFPGAANIGQTGDLYPIDGGRFSRFSIRARSTGGSSANVSINLIIGEFESSVGGGSRLLQNDGMHTLWWDTGRSGEFSGLQLNISGSPFVVDWVRLTDPDTSPAYTVTWSTTDVSRVNIYSDTDTDPSVKDQIADEVDAERGSYRWETGYLAPGTYYVYVEDADNPAGVGAYSPGPLTIRPAPVVEVLNPSRTSGPDYATDTLGNPWDFADSSDVALTYHLQDVTYGGGQLHAVTNGVDPHVRPKLAGTDSIDADYYKYLTYRLYVEGDWAHSFRRLGGGPDRWGVNRLILDLGIQINTFNDVIPWEGWHVYQMDLSRPGEEGPGTYYLDDEANQVGPGWTGLHSKIRLDFLEPLADDRWPIHLDYVLLTADPRPDSSGECHVQWRLLQGEPITTTLYYATDPATPCDDATPISQFAPSDPVPPPGPFRTYLPLVMTGSVESSFAWDVSSFPPGAYYVKVLADDGLNRTCWTSGAPLVIDP